MVTNSKFTVQLLEKIGSPLTAAINHVAGEKEELEIEAAKTMAQLLGVATQMSTTLYNSLDIKEEENQFDSTRVALAALVTPLIADFYIQTKQIPAEEDIKRIGQSLEAVISFGENFSPASDHQSRLQTIDHDGVFFDKDQPILVVLQAMVPVINAVEEFSFGQGKKKLVQDITVRLETRAADIAKEVGASDKLKELIIFKALAALYSSCHREETRRASSEDEAKRGELSLEPIWEAFETKVAMIEAIIGTGTEDTNQQQAPKVEAEKVVETPQADDTPPQQSPASGSTSGPMGFFKKPTDAPAETETKEATPAASAISVEEKKPEAKTETEATATSSASSSPMGFFKPGANKKEDSDAS